MCGIAGIISNRPIDMLVAKNMNDTLIHRGPDGEGYLCSSGTLNTANVGHTIKLNKKYNTNFVFTHRRLAIHDLSDAGRQPMSYLDKYWLVFNGEIYNFLELRTELKQRGYVFHSQTDSEVILAAYDFWGVDCLNKFNGEWAFALFDSVRDTIFISRDRFGIKPLYYFSCPDLFLFASEIKAILQHPSVRKKPNYTYLQRYLTDGPNEYAHETAFENIFHFDFSSYLLLPMHDLLHPEKIRSRKFWSLDPNFSMEKLDEMKLINYSETYYALLEDAVKVRLRADVSVAANLSGGLDSSSVLHCIKQNHQSSVDHSIQTFSSVYQTPGTHYCDESAMIKEIAHHLNVTSHTIEPSVNEIPDEHRKMIYYLDSPPESTLMSSWYTAKLVNSANIRVTLSGEGADEQLAGYLRYLAYYFSNINLRDSIKSYPFFKGIVGARSYLQVGLITNILKKLFGEKLTQFLYHRAGRNEKLFTPANEKLKQDIFSLLVNLHHVDERVFMAFSIEQRAPFMDHRLVEFLASVPIAYKLAKGNTKYLARHAFDAFLPASINWNKQKLGWPIPESFWFKGQLKQWMDDTIETSVFLNKDFFKSKINLHTKSLTKKIRLLNMAVWYDVFFK